MFKKLIRRFFLIKEILSKEGIIHFQRYRLLSTPWFNLYIHKICQSDMEKHMHDHPFDYSSLILSGAYWEDYKPFGETDTVIGVPHLKGNIVSHRAEDAHRLTLMTEYVWTLVLTSNRKRVWGYVTSDGWIDFKTYRQLKDEGKL